MSDLVVVAYPDMNRAEQVLETLGQMRTAQLIDLDDAVYVTKDAQGKVKLHQAVNLVSAGAKYGALWGGLWGRSFSSRLQARPLGQASAPGLAPSLGA